MTENGSCKSNSIRKRRVKKGGCTQLRSRLLKSGFFIVRDVRLQRPVRPVHRTRQAERSGRTDTYCGRSGTPPHRCARSPADRSFALCSHNFSECSSGIINPFNLSVQRCSADKPGSSGRTFAFSALYFCHSSYSLFVICFMAVTSLGGNLLLQIYHILCERKSNVKMSRIMLRVFDLPLYCSVCPFRCIQ